MPSKTQKLIGSALPPPHVALPKYVPPAVQQIQNLKQQVQNKYTQPTISQILKASGPALVNKIG